MRRLVALPSRASAHACTDAARLMARSVLLKRRQLARLNVLLPRLVAEELLARPLTGPLPVQRHDQQDRILDVHQQRNTAVHGRTAQCEAIGLGLGVHGVRHVDDQVQLAGAQHRQHVGLALHERLVHRLHVLEAMHLQELQGGLSGIELETHVDQHAGVLDKLGLLLRGADGDQDVLRRQLEAGGDHSLQEGLVLILAEASDLTSGLHLHTQPGVRVLQAAEGEDRHLGRDEIHVDGLDHDGALRDAQHDPRRNADEVDVVRLGDEGQGAGCSQVALDDHDLVLLAHELDVEGAGNVQCPADFLADALHAAVRLHEELLCGQEQRRISAVHTCVLHVLCDRIVDNLAIRADGVQLDLFSAGDVLRDDDGVITAHNGRVPQESLELLVRVDHTHCRTREHVRGAHQAWEARALCEVEGLVHSCELGPLRLVDPQGVAQLAEPESILAHVDGVDVRAQDLNAVLVQAHRQIVRRLPSHGDHDAGRLLQFRNVHDDLMAELFEVEPI
mmetsp:Transcript_105300/g.336859  ORF Transcript_105300/g.336859 Transcript_105300/m.336859 type:complete len:505 (+) Transcript_105300:297-1811(+)